MESVISTREEVQSFLSIKQPIYGSCGSGYGFSDCSGCGHGCGSGQGYPSKNGSGYGSGCGGGDSCSSGDGAGCNRGRGSDEGYSYDYNSSNDNILILNGNIVDNVDSLPTIIIQVKGNFAKGYIVKDDLTLESCYIAKVGNFFAHGKTLKDAVTDAEKKKGKRMSIEGRIKRFVEIFGSLDSEHTGKEYYDWHHILTNSCQMGRDKFCEAHDIDLSKKYTVKYFLDITKNSYGSNIIKLVKEAYKNMEE